MAKEWFEEWFDSPFYHTLYKSHDEREAQSAIDNLLSGVNLPPGAHILDLACGKGRHSRYLSEKGYDVTGIDISAKSIAYARQFEQENLHFYQHDMRLPFRINYFDAVVNFFTSFGYFSRETDHLKSLRYIAQGLRPGGIFILDFFNATWVRNNLVRDDHKIIENIDFHLNKHIRGGFVYKTVRFTAQNRQFHFREKVRLYTLDDFKVLFKAADLNIQSVYGDYDLKPFDVSQSKRLIIIAQKTEQNPARDAAYD